MSSDHDENNSSHNAYGSGSGHDAEAPSSSTSNGAGHSTPLPPPRRPRAQVSFRLPRHDEEEDHGNSRLAQSDPLTCGARRPRPRWPTRASDGGGGGGGVAATTYKDAPRNRRRLYRDMSYTSRAVRRDNASPGGRNPMSFGNHYNKRNNNANYYNNNNHGMTDEDHNLNLRDHHRSEEFQLQRSGRGQHLGRTKSPPRRQESFRGIHRRNSVARAGAPVSQRFKTYVEDKAKDLSSYVHGENNAAGRSSSSSTEETSPAIEQYCIPPPEEAKLTFVDIISQFYSSQFGDLAMWVHGASFGKCLLFFFALYLTFVYCFVVLLYLVDRYSMGSRCINQEEGTVLDTYSHFEFAFELSWTTFTTVGYGNVGPPPDTGCYPIRFVCSIEAILGMAYVSMCSGLFYAKLLKLLGGAQVTFSSTLCVQYGEGLEDGGVKLSSLKSGPRSTMQEEEFYSYPVIEFRIVNNRANQAPGRNEIWDAEVTALLQLSIENDPHGHVSGGMSEHRIPNTHWQSPTLHDNEKNDEHTNEQGQKVYYKLSLKPAFHPYFSRVWFLRHTLDATSPLLRREVRNHIKDRPQGWDPSFNNYQDIRDCLVEFNSIRVLMSGASALSRSDVYAEKVYTYDDLCVGWQYVAVCYEEEDNTSEGAGRCRQSFMRRRRQRKHMGFGDDMMTRVDLSLIHDILPQKGGDFEPVD